jgi:putative nucleotidyltransferase with HDIG domain
MWTEPSLEGQALLEDTFLRASSDGGPRERLAELLVGVGFVAAVAVLWAADPPHAFAVGPALLCTALMVLATLVRFDTPFGFTVATQLAYVPLVFALPVALAPIAVVLALALARMPEVLKGEVGAAKLLRTPGNAWFTIGPAAVFALAGVEPSAAAALLLVAALAAQFAFDFLISTLRFAIERGASIASQLQDSWVYAIDAALSGVALVVAEYMHTTAWAAASLIPLLGVLAVFAQERHRHLEGLLELNSAYRGTALVLGDVVEATDDYTGEHCKGVVALALAVGERLELDAAQLRNLEFGALLHDVGKIAIPNEIINKPGKLDAREWTIIRTHTIEGQRLLDRVGGFMREVGLIVRSHHERWDGGGYPDGLAGDQIPLEARIIACCDSWNAMRTDRAYRKALPHETALGELLSGSGTQFDPTVVEAVLETVALPAPAPIELPVGAASRLQVVTT